MGNLKHSDKRYQEQRSTTGKRPRALSQCNASSVYVGEPARATDEGGRQVSSRC